MNELTAKTIQLPDNVEDLAKFTLIGREKLNAVRAEIRAIEKVGLAKEVHEQKLQEAQEIAEAVLDAEAKIGELTSKMEKATNQYSAKDSGVHSTKSEQLEQIGITEKQKQRFETLARHPETVEQAKEDARAEGRIVTRQDVLNRIAPPKSEKQRIKDIKDKAREEHKTFEESSKNGVVNFEDIKNDKDNVELIALDTSMTINRSFSMITSLGFLKEKDIDLMAEHMTTQGRLDMISKGRDCIRVITQILKHIDRR